MGGEGYTAVMGEEAAISSQAPISTQRTRSRSATSLRIDGLAAKTWAGVVSASLPSIRRLRSLLVRCWSSAPDWYRYWGAGLGGSDGGGGSGGASMVGGTASGSLFLRFFFSVANTLKMSSLSESEMVSELSFLGIVTCSMQDSTTSSNWLAWETWTGGTC